MIRPTSLSKDIYPQTEINKKSLDGLPTRLLKRYPIFI